MYAQDNFVIRGNTAVMKSVIPEHVRDYVRVLSWHIKRNVITLGGKYSLMPSGDLIITNVDESEAKDKTYYYTAVNVLTGEKHYSNPAKIFLKGNHCIAQTGCFVIVSLKHLAFYLSECWPLLILARFDN